MVIIIINYTELSPSWEANDHSASQEVLRSLWKSNVHYRVHKSPHVFLILNQMNSAHNFPAYFSKIRSSIIFPTMPRYSRSLLFKFSKKEMLYEFRISYVLHASPISLSLTWSPW
jgi:hypothetical protein